MTATADGKLRAELALYLCAVVPLLLQAAHDTAQAIVTAL